VTCAPARKKVYGLTGGIASGKTTVARMLMEAGIPVLDADQVARELTAPGGKAHAAIQEKFGTTDKAALRERIFKDPQARKDLEAILHPLIRTESEKKIQSLPDPVVVYEAALLVETGRYRDFDGLIVVESPPEQRKARLLQRDGNTPEDADRILAAQLSDENRAQVATAVIRNTGTLAELADQVRDLIVLLKGAAG
jgi:dephospho-CoA kinase